MRINKPGDERVVNEALSPLLKKAADEEAEQPAQPNPKQPSPYFRALKAELYRIRGGHAPELQAAIDEMDPMAQQALLGVIRNLQDEVSQEKRKRQQGQFW